MNIIYNDINLRVVQPVLVSRQVKYDPTGKDYLGTLWTIQVIAIYSPDNYRIDPTHGMQVNVTAHSKGTPVPTGGPPASDEIIRSGTGEPFWLPNPLGPDQGQLPLDNFFMAPRYNSPPWTDAALRHKLSQPRAKLQVYFWSGLDEDTFPGLDPEQYGEEVDAPSTGSFGRQLWVESPKPVNTAPGSGSTMPVIDVNTDLDNGPKPTVENVQDIYGDGRLFLVTWGVTTLINDCVTNADEIVTNEPLLSNQWTASMSYDEQYLCTRSFTGMAVFRADMVERFIKNPWDYKFRVLPRLPLNCKRFIDELTALPDGYSFTYKIRDVEQALSYADVPLNKVGVATSGTTEMIPGAPSDLAPDTGAVGGVRNVTTFDVEVHRSYEQTGMRDIIPRVTGLTAQAFAAANSGLGAAAVTGLTLIPMLTGGGAAGGPAGAAVGTAIASALSSLIGGAVNTAVGAAVAGINAANEFLPEYTETITVTVAGNRFARMSDLQYLAFAAAFGQVSTPMATPEIFAAVFGGAVGAAAAVAGAMLPFGVGPIVRGAINVVANAPGLTVNALRFLPTANIYDVKYSPTRKQLQFTLVNSYGGIVDWVTGATAGGWRSIVEPIPDDVVGGNWPRSAMRNSVLAGAVANEAKASQFLPLIFNDRVPLAVGKDIPGIGPPMFSQPDPADPTVTQTFLGTQCMQVVAQRLMTECELPPFYVADPPPFSTPASNPFFGTGVLVTGSKQENLFP